MSLIDSEGDIAALAAELGRRLAARGAFAATAESCTGGLVAGAITAIAGSSGWFDRGFVTYTNAAKTELLGVDAGALERNGAVSEATAIAMAEGALRASRADCVGRRHRHRRTGGRHARQAGRHRMFRLGGARRAGRSGHPPLQRRPGRGPRGVSYRCITRTYR